MAFRFRRSARLGPLRLNFTRRGLSSISLGGPGASLNVPINRRGGLRTTLGLPGTGLSWTMEAAPKAPLTHPEATPWPAGDAEAPPNSSRLRSTQLESLRQSCLQMLQQRLFAPGAPAQGLWQHQLVSRLLSEADLGARSATQLAATESPGALEYYLGRARSQDEVKRRCQRCVDAVSLAEGFAASHEDWQRVRAALLYMGRDLQHRSFAVSAERRPLLWAEQDRCLALAERLERWLQTGADGPTAGG